MITLNLRLTNKSNSIQTKNLIVLSCALLLSIPIAAQNLLGNNNGNSVPITSFPAPNSKQKQIVINLPAKDNLKAERDYKVQLIAGKTMMVDCNSHGLNGNIEPMTLQGFGVEYYTFTTNGEVWATRMGCPDNSEHEEFVAAKPLMIEYTSKTPIVVYVPQGYEVRYRVWSAGKVMEPNLTATDGSIDNDELYQTWTWVCSKGGYAGRGIPLKNTGLSKSYTFKKDGTYLYNRNGKMVPAGKFKLSNAVSIFIKGKLPMIELAGKDRKMSYAFNGQDTLVLSEECYDCYQHTYVRQSKNATRKIQDCPDRIIENRMPQVIDRKSKIKSAPTTYYIYKGKRHEVSEFMPNG